MSSFIRQFVCAFLIVKYSLQCGSFGSGDDARIFTNPTFQWTMSPPAAWTYPVSYALVTSNFFPGQALTQNDATTQSQGDIQSAVINALSEASIPTAGVKVTVGYTPQEVSDCIKVAPTGTAGSVPTQTPAGGVIGVEERGAITKLLTVAAAVTPANCVIRVLGTYTSKDNLVQATAQVEGISISGYQLRQVAAQFQAILNYNYKVAFRSEITYS